MMLWFSLFVSDEVHHVEPDVAMVPHVQVPVFGAVGEHGEHSPWRPQVKSHVNRLPFQQVKSKSDPAVFGVGDVQDATGDEGVPSLGAGVCGVNIGGDWEGLLVQLGHHDALVHAGGEDQPQTVLICRYFEVGLGVLEQVGEVVMQRIFNDQNVKLPALKVESADGQEAYFLQRTWNQYQKRKKDLHLLTCQCWRYLRCDNRGNRCEPCGHSPDRTSWRPQLHCCRCGRRRRFDTLSQDDLVDDEQNISSGELSVHSEKFNLAITLSVPP